MHLCLCLLETTDPVRTRRRARCDRARNTHIPKQATHTHTHTCESAGARRRKWGRLPGCLGRSTPHPFSLFFIFSTSPIHSLTLLGPHASPTIPLSLPPIAPSARSRSRAHPRTGGAGRPRDRRGERRAHTPVPLVPQPDAQKQHAQSPDRRLRPCSKVMRPGRSVMRPGSDVMRGRASWCIGRRCGQFTGRRQLAHELGPRGAVRLDAPQGVQPADKVCCLTMPYKVCGPAAGGLRLVASSPPIPYLGPDPQTHTHTHTHTHTQACHTNVSCTQRAWQTRMHMCAHAHARARQGKRETGNGKRQTANEKRQSA